MAETRGTLIGVGVGPGDPELMTQKAVRVILEADILVAPTLDPKKSAAYQIARAAVPAAEKKEIIGLDYPMTKDREILRKAMDENKKQLREILDQGRDAAFLTLGDPTLYSTYFKVASDLQEEGYPIEIVSGVPSFCACAAEAKIPVATGMEKIRICPEVPETVSLEEGTTVFMKPGRKLPDLKHQLQREEEQKQISVSGVENCGMENERVFHSAVQISEDAGYFTTIIAQYKK